MKVILESNFFLLGPGGDLESIELDDREITLRRLLEVLSHRSPDSPEFFEPGGRELSPGWTVKVNGNPLGLNNTGLDTLVQDGDRVVINLELICGG
jgi:hypothetical protein